MARTPLKNKINRFFYRNRNRGIPRLMLYVAIANLVVYVLYIVNQSDPLFYRMLVFDRALILRGQVWRLVTYPFVYVTESGLLWGLIGMLFYYWCGSILEQYWGVLRLNVYYLMGILLTDVGALLLRATANVEYVNLSLFLALATVLPEEQIRIWFVIPIKMKWLAIIDLALTLLGVISGLIVMIRGLGNGGFPYLGWLLPIIALINYFLFFGKQSANLLPDFIRYHPTRKSWKRKVKTGTVYSGPRPVDNARFRCTVCGRTELSNPGLEFRYCSKCAGYRCYCQDHINNHAHITE